MYYKYSVSLPIRFSFQEARLRGFPETTIFLFLNVGTASAASTNSTSLFARHFDRRLASSSPSSKPHTRSSVSGERPSATERTPSNNFARFRFESVVFLKNLAT